jgi:hypothetical protein
MAIDIDTVRQQATLAVQEALAKLYSNADSDAMKGFAEAIAEAAVVAVQNVIDHAEVEQSGGGIR